MAEFAEIVQRISSAQALTVLLEEIKKRGERGSNPKRDAQADLVEARIAELEKPRWSDLFGIDPDWPLEKVWREQFIKLFEAVAACEAPEGSQVDEVLQTHQALFDEAKENR